MNRLLTNDTKVGGFPLILDDFRWFLGQLKAPNQQGIYQVFNNIFRGFGDDLKIQGAVASGTTPNVAITEGWVVLNGELLKVDAQTGINTSTDNKFKKVTTFDSRGNKTFQNAAIEDTYEINRAVIQGTSGNLNFDANAIFNVWNEFILTDSDIKAQDGSGMTLNVAATNEEKRIRFLITGNMIHLSIRIIGANASNNPLSGIMLKLPNGILATKEFEGSGNYRNSTLGSETANQPKNTGTRITTFSSVFFDNLGDSLRIAPQRDGFENFDTDGSNNLNVTGEIFFEI